MHSKWTVPLTFLKLGGADTVSEMNNDSNIFTNAIYQLHDQTASTVQALFLAMALYPEVQKKAQEEIDAVVGPNRLPDFEDRPFLPYINAITKESMRWHLVGPLGKPFFYRHAYYYYALS